MSDTEMSDNDLSDNDLSDTGKASWRDDLLVETDDPLLLGKLGWVLGCVGEEVVDLLEAEILAVVVRFRHFDNLRINL